MIDKLISVIIPCYKVEKYIDRCLESIVNQTIGIEKLEIILVNDASPDNTYEKLLEWERKYPESIMVISYEENLRQGGARNVGIGYASCDWIGFVDSDDWCELDMYETLYEPAKSGKYEVVFGKYIRDPGGKAIDINVKTREDREYFFEKVSGYSIPTIKGDGNNGERAGTVANLISRDLILKNSVFFPEKLAYEDNYWMNILLLYANGLFIVDKIVYHYFVNSQSTVMAHNQSYLGDKLVIEVMILEKYKELGIFEDFYYKLEIEFLYRFYFNTLSIIFRRFDFMPPIFADMRETLFLYFPNIKGEISIKDSQPDLLFLFGLLDLEMEPTAQEWGKIKETYLRLI